MSVTKADFEVLAEHMGKGLAFAWHDETYKDAVSDVALACKVINHRFDPPRFYDAVEKVARKALGKRVKKKDPRSVDVLSKAGPGDWGSK